MPPDPELQIRAVIDQAQDELIFIGPDHPYYPLLTGLVSAIGVAWQQGYDQRRAGGPDANPYRWNFRPSGNRPADDR